MKIVCVCRVSPAHRPGGMIFVLQDRAEALAALGHEVIVLSTGDHKLDCEAARVLYRHLPCKPQAYTAEFAELCARECERIRPDVLHLDSFDRDRPWFKDRPGRPDCVAITMHGTGIGEMLTFWNKFREGRGEVPKVDWEKLNRESDGLQFADVQIGISKSECLHLQDMLSCRNVKLVYNPIPSYFFTVPKDGPLKVTKDGPLICAAIDSHANRGFDIAQEVCAKLGRTLKVLQDVPRDKMPAEYDACSGVLLPTHFAQGFDLVVAEAIARNRPVFATPTGSYSAEGPALKPWLTITDGYEVDDFCKAINGWQAHFEGRSLVGKHRPEAHAAAWLDAVGV